jgi:3-methyladenine DNA glycosylase AlkD
MPTAGKRPREPEDAKATTAASALARLREEADPERALILQRFFKTGKGEYAEGDRFLGITVPTTRAVARRCVLPLDEACRLLMSEFHEARLLALVLFAKLFKEADLRGKRTIYEAYLSSTPHINNWDLVDVSAPSIVGAYLEDKPRRPLEKLARSSSLWERRIAMVATQHFIRRGESADAIAIAKVLLDDPHDLIHKASGWMLREVGERCGEPALTQFLDEHAAEMPRTMLRYAIEHLSPAKRNHYMSLRKSRQVRPNDRPRRK